jgi:hypothetical protein
MIFFSVIETTKSRARDAYIRKIFKANVGKKGEFQFAVFSFGSQQAATKLLFKPGIIVGVGAGVNVCIVVA